MVQKNNKYTTPKLNKTKENAWYIGFSFNGKSCRFKLDFNRIPDLQERELEFNKMISAMKIKLQQGEWNPLIKNQVKIEKTKTIIEALDFAIEKKKGWVTKASMDQYQYTLGYFKKAIISLKIDNTPITDINRQSVMVILEQTTKMNNASNKSYNTYLNHFRNLLGIIHKWELIPYNPALKIDYMPYEESRKHEPPTKEQLVKIVNHLRTNHSNFWNFIEFYYYSGRRPDEILKLQIKLLNDETIVLKPSNAKNTGKIKRYQNIVITKQMAEIIDRIKVKESNSEFFIFGQQSEIYKTQRYKSGGFYIPAKDKVRIQTASRHWEVFVQEELGINVSLYSFKKLATNHKLLSGISISAVSEFLGHSDTKTTKIYATKLEEINRKEIIEKSKSIDDFLK